MSTIGSIEIDPVILERFETVLPSGTVFAGFITDRSVIFPGHRDAEEFTQQAHALVDASQHLGWIDSRDRLSYMGFDSRAVQHLWAVPELNAEGGLDLVWHDAQVVNEVVAGRLQTSSVSACALTRGSIPVSLIEV